MGYEEGGKAREWMMVILNVDMSRILLNILKSKIILNIVKIFPFFH